MKMKFFHVSLLVFTLNVSCKDDDDSNAAAPQLASDTELSEAGMSANMQDAMDAMSDGNANGESLALTTDSLDLSRTCTVDGNKAVVDLSADFEAEKTVGGKNNSVVFAWTSAFSLKRTWSQDGVAIACDATGKFAKIDLLADPSRIKADVSFTRDVSASHTITNTKNNTVKKSARTFKAVGTRAITFASQTTNADATVTRNLTISSDVKRTLTITKKNGVEATVELQLATDAAAPLVVEAKHQPITYLISERTVKSGKLIASTAGQGKVESVFENLKISFSGIACQPESGKATMSVFAEGAATASLIYEITADAGAYVVTNITDPTKPVEVDDFAVQVCDIRDFNY